MEQGQDKFRALLLDDDPSFTRLMEAVAKQRGIKLDCYHSVAEILRDSPMGPYQAIIVDYYLGDESAFDGRLSELGLLRTAPVIMISGTRYMASERNDWATVIDRFVPKARGPVAILEAVERSIEHSFATAHGHPAEQGFQT